MSDVSQMHDRSSSNEAAGRVTQLLHENVNDIDRMKVAAQLVNTFNFAILKQARRPLWNEQDMRAFVVAMAAINTIGQMDTPVDEERPQEHGPENETLDGLEAEVSALGISSVEQHRTQMPAAPAFGQRRAVPQR